MKQALILAAGRGARLDRPNTPKPLVDVGGQPIIVRLINQLKKEGIEEIHIVVGHESKRIMHTLAAHFGFDAGLVFHTANNWQLGSAHSILTAQKWMTGTFLLAMADHIFDDRLIARMVHHAPRESAVTALVDARLKTIQDTETPVRINQKNHRVEDVGTSIVPYNSIDAGLFTATPILFDVLHNLVQRHGGSELTDGLRVLAKTESLSCIEVDNEYWFDVDLPKDVIRAEMFLRNQQRSRRLAPPHRQRHSNESITYHYRLQSDETARMIFQRGLVQSPERFALIPPKSASSPIFVFSDETVNRLYADSFVGKLRAQGYDIHCIILPDGEEAKTISNYVYLVERVLSRGVDEHSMFISLGGGVVCNVCGFVASTIYRGLELVHVPTTLMAQCDAAISHKQAINGHFGKNMVGTYYKPSMVLIDVDVLETLDNRQISDGFAEVIKHALGQDPHLAAFLLHYEGSMRDRQFLETVIQRNVSLKCELVTNDPKELAEAMVLQYGHTAGHPIEHLSGYRLYHGESVAIGMMVAAQVARIIGACDDEMVRLHQTLIEKFHLPTTIPADISLPDFMDALRFNKRYVVEGSQMALLDRPGSLWQVNGQTVIPVSDEVMKEAFCATQAKNDTVSIRQFRRTNALSKQPLQAVSA
ncbi:MAG: iron-containing alcohol dehydrogenase [Deltaproteobacteria bacterium]|nr:iron-containing alcohol dehydrogenase [Deltaproteobacteria bacterium]MBN2674271.1 iron-containing alcohol dehydrogenase [Deltaproteobacteria bacterium]